MGERRLRHKERFGFGVQVISWDLRNLARRRSALPVRTAIENAASGVVARGIAPASGRGRGSQFGWERGP